jgi:hypothetical protein
MISSPQHSQTVLHIAIYILEPHSLQLLCQTFVHLGYTLFGNDSASTDHNVAFTKNQHRVYPKNMVFNPLALEFSFKF